MQKIIMPIAPTIWLPKYQQVESQPIIQRTRYAGKYRAILRGPSGEIKYDSGWHDNRILNRGFYEIVIHETVDFSLRHDDPFRQMSLGDSGTAIADSQTGLQGTALSSKQDDTTAPYYNNAGAPNYERTTGQKFVFSPGDGTGTVQEFCIHPWNANPATEGTVRVVLAAPIVKGALDELSIEHRLTVYPDLTDRTGTFTLDTDYNYTARHYGVGLWPYANTTHLGNLENRMANLTAFSGMTLQPNTAAYSAITKSQFAIYTTGTSFYSETWGGSGVGTWYHDTTLTLGIDDSNGTFNGFCNLFAGDGGDNRYGMQMTFGKVSDGSAFTKPNTHEVMFTWRNIPSRYP